MGRRKRTKEKVEKRVRIEREEAEFIEAEAKKQGISFSECMVNFTKKGIRAKTSKYKGFREVVMSSDFVCFKCGQRYKAGKLAMYDSETGGAVCMECAVKNKMTTKARAKLIVTLLELREDVRALKVERKKEAEKYREEYVERVNNLGRMGIIEKIEKAFKEANERHKMWMRYHNQDYEVEGKSEKEAFETFMMHDDDFLSLLRDLRAEYERAMEEKRKLLAEKARKQRKKKKKQTYAT